MMAACEASALNFRTWMSGPGRSTPKERPSVVGPVRIAHTLISGGHPHIGGHPGLLLAHLGQLAYELVVLVTYNDAGCSHWTHIDSEAALVSRFPVERVDVEFSEYVRPQCLMEARRYSLYQVYVFGYATT